ncbi:hypothetical protein E3E35_10845 [Thermococcus sp. GR7]|nr:hypothetical protein [Thermococcus sp. GR7]
MAIRVIHIRGNSGKSMRIKGKDHMVPEKSKEGVEEEALTKWSQLAYPSEVALRGDLKFQRVMEHGSPKTTLDTTM